MNMFYIHKTRINEIRKFLFPTGFKKQQLNKNNLYYHNEE